MKKTILLGIAATAMLASCSNDDVVEVKAPNAIGFNTFVDNVTRGNDVTTSNISEFAVWGFTKPSGDDATAVQIFAAEPVKKAISTNQSTAGWGYTNTQYWVSGNSYTFSAVSPIPTSSNGITYSVGKGTSAGTLTFNNETAASDVDLVYAYQTATGAASNNADVGFTFNHLLSRVKFAFTNTSNEGTLLEIYDVTITDAYKSGSIDVSKIAATATNSETAFKTLTWTLDAGTYGISFGTVTKTSTGEAASTEVLGSDTQANAILASKEAYTEHYYVIPKVGESATYNVTFKVKVYAKTNEDKYVEYGPYDGSGTFSETMYKGYSYLVKANISATDIPTDDDKNKLQPIKFTVTAVTDWATFTDTTYNLTNN